MLTNFHIVKLASFLAKPDNQNLHEQILKANIQCYMVLNATDYTLDLIR